MNRSFLMTGFAALMIGATHAAAAQATDNKVTEHDPAVNTKDSLVKVQIIDPAEQLAAGKAPDWSALTQTIVQKYDSVTADRTITKAKIYYYYGKDWPQFTAGIVHYTNNYELATDYNVLNANANWILKFSKDPKELQEAQRWAEAAVKGNPAEAAYKSTLAAVQEKLKAK